MMKFSQFAYVANTKGFNNKTEFWTCFGNWVPPLRAGVYICMFLCKLDGVGLLGTDLFQSFLWKRPMKKLFFLSQNII